MTCLRLSYLNRSVFLDSLLITLWRLVRRSCWLKLRMWSWTMRNLRFALGHIVWIRFDLGALLLCFLLICWVLHVVCLQDASSRTVSPFPILDQRLFMVWAHHLFSQVRIGRSLSCLDHFNNLYVGILRETFFSDRAFRWCFPCHHYVLRVLVLTLPLNLVDGWRDMFIHTTSLLKMCTHRLVGALNIIVFFLLLLHYGVVISISVPEICCFIVLVPLHLV